MTLFGQDIRKIFGAIVIIVAFFALGYAWGIVADDQEKKSFSEERTESEYKYINPLLECDHGEDISSDEFLPSERAIQQVIDEHEAVRDASDVAVYYRDMNNGPWFSIHS